MNRIRAASGGHRYQPEARVLMLRFFGTDQSRRLIETAGALVPTQSMGTRIWRRCDHVQELRTLREAWRQLRNIKKRERGPLAEVIRRCVAGRLACASGLYESCATRLKTALRPCRFLVDTLGFDSQVLYKLSMECKSNRNVVYSCKYHVVWCPKYRRAVLTAGVDERLKEILRGVIAETRSELFELEVMPDHVHLVVEVDPQFGIHRLIKRAKGRSSRFLRREFPWLKSRLPTLWTNSYFVSTVGGSPLSVVKRYIEDQKRV